MFAWNAGSPGLDPQHCLAMPSLIISVERWKLEDQRFQASLVGSRPCVSVHARVCEMAKGDPGRVLRKWQNKPRYPASFTGETGWPS